MCKVLAEKAAARAALDFCVCGQPSQFECSSCEQRGYCSLECQRRDWSQHKPVCKQQQNALATVREEAV